MQASSIAEDRNLDNRLSGLVLDMLAPVEAAAISAAAGVPYTTARAAVSVSDEQRAEFARAAEAAAAAHADWFTRNRAGVEFITGLMAITAAQVDGLLTLGDAAQAGAGQEPAPCSKRDALVIGLIVLAPMLLLVGIEIYKLLKEG